MRSVLNWKKKLYVPKLLFFNLVSWTLYFIFCLCWFLSFHFCGRREGEEKDSVWITNRSCRLDVFYLMTCLILCTVILHYVWCFHSFFPVSSVFSPNKSVAVDFGAKFGSFVGCKYNINTKCVSFRTTFRLFFISWILPAKDLRLNLNVDAHSDVLFHIWISLNFPLLWPFCVERDSLCISVGFLCVDAVVDCYISVDWLQPHCDPQV